MTIINFKASAELKQAVRIASAKEGYANVSAFLSAVIRANPTVEKELKKKTKKVV